MRVTIVLIMEMKNLPTHAVLDFTVLVEMKNLSQAQHVVHPATSVLKARTTWQHAQLAGSVICMSFMSQLAPATLAITVHQDPAADVK